MVIADDQDGKGEEMVDVEEPFRQSTRCGGVKDQGKTLKKVLCKGKLDICLLYICSQNFCFKIGGM